MAQTEVFDPRIEVLTASRHRSGSLKMENNENLPPLNPVIDNSSKNTSQFIHLRTRFEDSSGGSGGPGSRTGAPLLGSNVSKIKERFQKSEDKKAGDGHFSASSSVTQTSRGRDGGDRSPEIKKMKVTDIQGSSSACSVDSKTRTSAGETGSIYGYQHYHSRTPPLSPTRSVTSNTHSLHSPSASTSHAGLVSHIAVASHAGLTSPKRRKARDGVGSSNAQESNSDTHLTNVESSLLEATNHVQRFNYTRAMFARMEEETKRAQEREKIIRRKPSPSRPFPGSIVPQLSHVPVPIGLEPKRLQATRDQHRDFRRPKSMSDVSGQNLMGSSESFKRLSDSGSSVTIKPEDVKQNLNGNATAQPASQLAGSRDSAESSKPEQVLRSRRPQRGPVKRDDSGDRSGKYFSNIDALKALEDIASGQSVGESSRLRLNKTDSTDSRDRSSSSSLSSSSSSPPPHLPHSSRLGHSIRAGYRARAQAAASQQGSHSKPSSSHSKDSDKTSSSSSVVRRQRRQPPTDEVSGEEEATKRLSKEEIEASIEKADNYLANIGSPGDRKPEKTKEDQVSSSRQSQGGSAAARRRFFEPDTLTTSSAVEDSSTSQKDQLESSGPERESESSSSPSVSPGVPPSPLKSKASVVVRSPTSSSESLDIEATPDLPPPSYHEITEPPPYHEATSTASMLISQKVLKSQHQHPPGIPPVSGSQPVPVPRRVAPPPPLPKQPPVGNGSDSGVPPPAPEPGSSECVSDLTSPPGNASLPMLDSNISDDLILPEEQIAHHHNLDLQNGDLDTTSFARNEFLITRDPGDGKEDTRESDAVLSDGEPLEIDYSNLSFLEIAPISSEEEDDSSEDEIIYHKPSRVCFSKNPIKVFATYSTNDYDRRNEDVDPVAASAEYELEKRVEKMDVFPVILQKGTEGLGLSIIGMGVGADAGLEKLGIFIKTLTANGAAQRSKKIEVNDQIIEVDGKSLVGVTQAYAASVLRNTSGEVNFLIGREKDPSKSEVARLIQQSLEQDRRREEMRDREQQRLHQLEDNFQPKDEVLERHVHSHQYQQQRRRDMGEDSSSDAGGDEKEGEGHEDHESSNYNPLDGLSFSERDRLQLEQETAAGDTTPQSTPSNGEDIGDSSPEVSEIHAVNTGTATLLGLDDTPGSSSDAASPDMESEKLYIRLKESQYKLAVAEAELAKLKAKLLGLESSEGQKKLLEKKLEDLNRRFQERDKHFDSLKKELAQYKDMMVASQSQHIELEKKVKELGALEKKYHKAKKLIKDYQLREKDFIQERESLLEQQSEKDQQYNSLVKSLKDRIFKLEKNLTDVQKAAGLPPTTTTEEELEVPITLNKPTPLVRTMNHALDEPLSPLNQSTDDVLDTSTCSEISEPAASPVSEETFTLDRTLAVSSSPVTVDLGVIEPSFLMTEESYRLKLDSLLGSSSPSSLNSSHRDKPTTMPYSASTSSTQLQGRKIKAQSQESLEEPDSDLAENSSVHSNMTDQAESGLDMWNKHDSPTALDDFSDGTVRKSELKKRKQYQLSADVNHSPPPHPSPTHFIPSTNQNKETVKPPVAPKPMRSASNASRKDDTNSDTSSSVSQTSYDPNRPNYKVGSSSEIADDTSTNSDGGVTLISAKASSSKGFGIPKFHWKPSPKGRDNGKSGGVVLLSNRPLVHQHSASDPGLDLAGGSFLSRKHLNPESRDYDASSINSDIISSMMVGEPESGAAGRYVLNISGGPPGEDGPIRQNHQLSGPVTEWSTENVCQWLTALDMEKYTATFREKNVTGSQLLHLDSSKMKTLGFVNSKDRELMKKRIKELRANAEREKKLQEKERKLKEKEQKKMAKKK